MSAKKLTDKQKAFVDEYLKDMNATAAYKRAGYSVKSDNAAGVEAHKLLRNPKIAEALAKRQADRAHRTEITQDMVLQRLWAIATADPNELVHLRRLCCRHCFGIDHAYQWRDEAEYSAAVQLEREDALANNREPNLPTNEGGYGYDKLERPHPKCPQCRGEGRADLHMSDTRDVSAQAKLLYAGVKATQAGIEIKMQDQQKALELVARHLGMFKDKVELSGNEGGPLQVLFNIPRPPKPTE